MDPKLEQLLKKYNERHMQPLSQEELEEADWEEILSETPRDDRTPKGEHWKEEYGIDTIVDDPFNYGITTHRGPLSETESELLDRQVVKEAIADWLGEALEDILRVYGPGGKTKQDLELRGRVDEKLLQAVEKGASKVSLARGMGWGLRKPHNQSPVLQKALKRARKARNVSD